jgi:hypothetical protein
VTRLASGTEIVKYERRGTSKLARLRASASRILSLPAFAAFAAALRNIAHDVASLPFRS